MTNNVLIVLENIELGGLKRATTVVGNALSERIPVTYYSMSDAQPFYTLTAPLIVAPRPIKINHEAQPLTRYADQIADLITTIQAQKIDTVIVTAGVLTSFAPKIKAALPDVTVIAWMHNNIQTYLNQYYVAMRDEFEAGLRAADVVVALTDVDREGFLPYNAQTVKMLNPLTLTNPGLRADLSQKVIAFTGRIAIQHKGIDYLLALAQRLPADWRIAIAGGALVQEDQDTFGRLIEELEVADKIIYRGALKDDGLREHYQNASIFVMTSRWEGLPLVLAEAMSFGLPIAAMWNTGAQEVLQDGQYGVLTAAQDVDALYEGLKPLLADEAVRADYAQRSLNRVTDFEITPIRDAWVALIASTRTDNFDK
jgi:glycosyltransferase involved in cell wall biosynthesis